MKTFIKTFDELTTGELYEILKARFDVFVMEQHCFYLDMDDIDYHAIHIFMTESQQVMAYARLFPQSFTPELPIPQPNEKDAWHFGRLLTRRRGIGLGKQMVETILQVAEQNHVKTIYIEAQTHAIGFYEKFGFQVISEPFEEAGIMHVEMKKMLCE